MGLNKQLLDKYEHYGENLYWEMKNFDLIKLKDMKESHVNNTLRMLRRNQKTNWETWVHIFEQHLLTIRMHKIEKIKENVLRNKK